MFVWILTIFIAVQPPMGGEEQRLKHQIEQPFRSLEECLVASAQAQVTVAEEFGDALKMTAGMCVKATEA